MDDALTRDEQDALEADGWAYAGGGLGEGGRPYLKFTKNRETWRGSRAYWRAVIADIKPMSDLHDERMREPAAMVVDLRARLAALESSNAAFQRSADEWRERALRAEAERDALKKALKEIDRHVIGAYETAAGSVEPCDECGEMREIAAQGLARAAALDGKP